MPETPGVYFFMGGKRGKRRGKEVLYIGKAASIRDRVKSYFGNDILKSRGLHIANMVTLANTVKFIKTESVLEALLLENKLIKKYKPRYNTKEKDDKTYNYVVLTKEEFPKVLVFRKKDLENKLQTKNYKLKTIFGPFPQGTLLREAMKIIRKIFPYRDNCTPCLFPRDSASSLRYSAGCKPCFNRQLGLCPGVCTGEISSQEYGKVICNLKSFFEGKKSEVLRSLKREMKQYSKEMQFEKADIIKKRIFALKHIKDIALVKDIDRVPITDKRFRIEAYDIAHISGTSRVGVMVVIENGSANKSEYRKFKLQKNIIDDVGGLAEILERRLKHSEWATPDLIVVDGSTPQKNITEKILKKSGVVVPVVAVVKNERHKPERIIGDKSLVDNFERQILLSNSEAHRFAVSYHRNLRSRGIKTRKIKTA